MVPGTNLKDRYRLGRFPFAHRGMGEVWPAEDLLLDRAVVVKFVSAARLEAELVRRFRREALLTARLDHPGVPAIYDLGEHAGLPYVVLQRIDGITLTDLVGEQGPLPLGWVAAIGAQVCGVLLAARRIGLVHRDIKPSNVMLDTSGAVKVLDFGLAVVRDDDRYSRITQTGHSLGTVGYMAPEQILGEPTDHRTDLYGLGATLFDLLTGCPPFDGVTTTTTLRRQLDGPPPHPAQLRPDIPDDLDDLVHALLAVDPGDRPATAADVHTALAPYCHDLPPIPGVLTDTTGAVRAWAAIVGRVPPQTRPTTTPTTGPAAPTAPAANLTAAKLATGDLAAANLATGGSADVDLSAEHAERLYAAGEYRAAARQWRSLIERRARQHGDDDPQVFDLRLRVARAHLALGEHSRAARLLQDLLADRVRAEGPGHPAVLRLRQEIARLSPPPTRPGQVGGAPPAPRRTARHTPNADR